VSRYHVHERAKNEAPWVLGVSASHNGAACLLKGDEIVVAVQEERLTRIKRDRIYAADHSRAIAYCLDYGGIQPADLDVVVLSAVDPADDPRHDIDRNPLLNLALTGVPAIRISHHLAHAVHAFATSGFRESAVLVVDGKGSPSADLPEAERSVITHEVPDGAEIISLYAAADIRLVPLEKHLVESGNWLTMRAEGMPLFGSLGGMFSAAAHQIFADPAEAGKVMGLALYGRAVFPVTDFFDISGGTFCFRDRVPGRFAHHDRWPLRDAEYRNLACSVQAALEAALLHLVRHLRDLCRSTNLCYSGGVALNSVANERVIRECGFENVHITPAAEDSGPAIGAAYHGLWQLTGRNARRRMTHDACGRIYDPGTVGKAIESTPGIRSHTSVDAISDAVDLLCDGKILGWFDGRSELGPRSLGQRSIVCDPRRSDAKDVLNSRVKKREPFRPFAPVVLLEQVADWFEVDGVDPASPFMLRVCRFKADKRHLVPAVVHVDNTGRLQTVTREANGRFYELVKRFYDKTGVPMLLNTSFNVGGEPIVETPADAILCLLKSGLDACVFDDRIVFKHVTW
jgi:carbamoyltransferase